MLLLLVLEKFYIKRVDMCGVPVTIHCESVMSWNLSVEGTSRMVAKSLTAGE